MVKTIMIKDEYYETNLYRLVFNVWYLILSEAYLNWIFNESQVCKMSSELSEILRVISNDAEKYFEEAEKIVSVKEDIFGDSYIESYYYWDQLTDELQKKAIQLINRILPPCAQLAELAKTSTLTGTEDIQDIKLAAKAIRAALRLRKFYYSSLEVLHDEGSFIGVREASQGENNGLSPSEAKAYFNDQLSTIGAVLKLIEASPKQETGSTGIAPSDSHKYRAGTAFIMMWMDPKNPELTDIMDAVKDVFKRFSIRAVRADDIEHEGQITERILNEIKTAEFLFADLTGMRPNVYYETGYAHALGKRVILFRKSKTDLHFDLAGYNCPEYENLRDLKDKLTRRLIHITNKEPINSEKN